MASNNRNKKVNNYWMINMSQSKKSPTDNHTPKYPKIKSFINNQLLSHKKYSPCLNNY